MIQVPVDEQIRDLDEDIAVAERQQRTLGMERARITNEPEVGQAIWRLEQTLRAMRKERAALVARLEAEDEE